MADPGFPRGGGTNSPGGGGHQHTILPNFLKNFLKLNEFGPGGGVPHTTLRPTTELSARSRDAGNTSQFNFSHE